MDMFATLRRAHAPLRDVAIDDKLVKDLAYERVDRLDFASEDTPAMAMRGNATMTRRYDRASRRHVPGVAPFGRFVSAAARGRLLQRARSREHRLADLRRRSAILPAVETSGAVNLVGAMYNLETGLVEFFG